MSKYWPTLRSKGDANGKRLASAFSPLECAVASSDDKEFVGRAGEPMRIARSMPSFDDLAAYICCPAAALVSELQQKTKLDVVWNALAIAPSKLASDYLCIGATVPKARSSRSLVTAKSRALNPTNTARALPKACLRRERILKLKWSYRMRRDDEMKLGLFLVRAGFHEGAWRDPAVPASGGVDVDHYAHLAALAEDAAFHFVFLADNPGVLERDHAHIARVSRNDGFEPITLLSALSSRTQHIGLVATATTTYHQPYHLARMFASLDHLSRGRAAWNIVTSGLKFEAANFGEEELPAHDTRYARAKEFVKVVKGLWDTWEDDAFIRDKQSGIFADTTKLHLLNHRGDYLSVRGPLNIARPPQGYPVLVQAGASDAGIEFAAEVGEVVFTAEPNLENGKRYYAALKEKARALGREDDQVLVMPGIVPIVGKTKQEASEKVRKLQSYTHIEVQLGLAERLLGFVTDLRSIDLDSLVPEILPQTNATQSTQKLLLELAVRRKFTWRQLIRWISEGKGFLVIVGTPDEIADVMVDTFDQRAADGFNVMPATVPGGLKDFIELVVPELRRRKRFRSRYSGRTLRENLGLKRPLNGFTHAGVSNRP